MSNPVELVQKRDRQISLNQKVFKSKSIYRQQNC